MSGSGDYISREALVARIRYHIEKAKFCGLENHEATQLLTEAADALEQIPAADVRSNVTGKFYLQYNGDGCWHCSECNYQARYPSNFCPNCGADMRGESDV